MFPLLALRVGLDVARETTCLARETLFHLKIGLCLDSFGESEVVFTYLLATFTSHH